MIIIYGNFFNIVSFQIHIDIDRKNKDILIYKGKDRNHLINTISGSEIFFIDLAFRISLSRISNLPKPDFIFIDEGFGALDDIHLDKISNVFEYLKSMFKFIIVISHIEKIKNMANKFITIEKNKKGFSRII